MCRALSVPPAELNIVTGVSIRVAERQLRAATEGREVADSWRSDDVNSGSECGISWPRTRRDERQIIVREYEKTSESYALRQMTLATARRASSSDRSGSCVR